MWKIRSRVLLVGKPNNGKGLTRIVVMKKGKKSPIIKAVRREKKKSMKFDNN